jgi:hypothetical protein
VIAIEQRVMEHQILGIALERVGLPKTEEV